jgi:hypothetical protein
MKAESIVRSIRVPKSILEKAEDNAKRDSRNLNQVIVMLLKKYIGVKIN